MSSDSWSDDAPFPEVFSRGHISKEKVRHRPYRASTQPTTIFETPSENEGLQKIQGLLRKIQETSDFRVVRMAKVELRALVSDR